MRIASLFSGIGGFEKGILQAKPNAEIVFSSEIDKYARQIYKKNYGVEPHGDITKIKASNIPDHDILCGGFPCQAFSIAGKRRGFEDTRGTLFFEIVRIAKAKRPKLLFLENVRGLLSHDEGRTFHTILISMDDLGYDAEWQMFNSKNHGVPQNRERVFIIGHLRGAGTRPIFPITNSIEEISKERKGDNISTGCISTRNQSGQANWDGSTTLISNAIDSNYYKGIDNHGQRTAILCDSGPGRKDQLRNETIPPLRANTGAGHNNIVVKRAPLKFAGRNQKNYDEGDYAFTIDSCNTDGIEITEEQYDSTYNKNIRRLTPIECERLQGFPQLESYININIHNNTICVDLQKSYVNVEIRNHKQQKYAGNVEKSEVKENVSYVEQNLNTNNLPINKPAQKNVVINCVEETVEIHNQKKSYSFANYVESQNSYLQHIKTEDFVHLLAGINITLKNAMHFGKEVLYQNEQYLIQVQNGKLFVNYMEER